MAEWIDHSDQMQQPGAALLEQHRLLLRLFRLTAELAAALDAPDVALRAADQIVRALPDADRVSLWLFDRVEQQLHLAASASADPAIPRIGAMPDLILELDNGAQGVVLRDGTPIVLPDREAVVLNLRQLPPTVAARIIDQIVSLPAHAVVLPLQLGVIPIGVLELGYRDGAPPVDPETLALLQRFADQLAVVLRNTQIYAEMSAQHHRLQSFDAVVRAITAADDPQQMLDQTLAVVLPVAGAWRGAIGVIDGSDLCIAAQVGLPEPAFARDARYAVDGALFGHVIATAQPGEYGTSGSDAWIALHQIGVVEVALVPLLAASTLVGVLVIAFDLPPAVPIDWSSLLAIGAQIGTAWENHQLYAASQRERRQLAGVIASIVEGVLICDRHGQLVLSNDAAAAMLQIALTPGMSIDQLRALLRMTSADGAPLPDDAMPLTRGLRGEVYQGYDLGVVSGNDTALIISCSGGPLLADDGTIDGAVVVFRDVTAYRLHDTLRDEFVQVAAHEMRAPLAAIKGYTDLLVQREMQRSSATEQDRRGIRLLARQIDHLVRLVDNLLDVSRLEAGRLELYIQPADLVVLLESSIERIRIGDANHEFGFNGPPSLPLLCDQVRMQQVFTNVLSNAARYSAAGTTISVDLWTEACTIDNGAIVGDGGSDQCAVVAVRDRGVGMTPEVQAQVFEKYYRANTATAASGLGLGVYLSREIVSLHGGQIWLDSTPGVGTTFYVRLPIIRQMN